MLRKTADRKIQRNVQNTKEADMYKNCQEITGMYATLALLIKTKIKRMVYLALLQQQSSLPLWQDDLDIFRS